MTRRPPPLKGTTMRPPTLQTSEKRRHARRWIWVCRFADGSLRYPTGHGQQDGHTIMLFSDNKEDALSSNSRDSSVLTIGWVYLLRSHARLTGQKFQGVICRANQQPDFSRGNRVRI